jgi:hypothetical protein
MARGEDLSTIREVQRRDDRDDLRAKALEVAKRVGGDGPRIHMTRVWDDHADDGSGYRRDRRLFKLAVEGLDETFRGARIPGPGDRGGSDIGQVPQGAPSPGL